MRGDDEQLVGRRKQYPPSSDCEGERKQEGSVDQIHESDANQHIAHCPLVHRDGRYVAKRQADGAQAS